MARDFKLSFVLLAAACVAAPTRAADVMPPNPNCGAAVAFARYTASQDAASPWAVETIDIQASLPHMSRRGRMHAIRRMLPFGQLDYRILEISGDEMVRQQVLARYVTADMRASEIPAAAMAVTPSNYRFRYKGPVMYGGRLAYAFQVTPRKKREGLLKGELWLDGESGLAIRQSGYLVKNPSIFIKRVTVTREIALRDGMVAARSSHVTVETRLVGRAELVIEEQPATESDGAALSGAAGR